MQLHHDTPYYLCMQNPNKVLNVSLIIYYNRYTVPTNQITCWNYTALIIEHEFPLTSHLKCIVCAFCMLHFTHMNSTGDRNMRRKRPAV